MQLQVRIRPIIIIIVMSRSRMEQYIRISSMLILFLLLSKPVFSQVPELTLLLRGMVIPENEALDKEDVGTDEAGALSVVTPYSGDASFYYVSGFQVQEESAGFSWISSSETFSNGSQIIRLRRRRNEEQCCLQEGVWRCSVPSDANGGQLSIYFGLYSRSMIANGVLRISSPPTLTAVSPLLTEPPTYTLIARTTGGPPANVEWTVNGAVIDGIYSIDSDHHSDREDANYTHTLVVRGRQSGVVRFTVSNRRTSPAAVSELTIYLLFPNPPTNVQASQVGEGRVQVTWTRPTGDVDVNEFIVSVPGQPRTYLPGATTVTLTLATGIHEITVVSISSMNGYRLYSAGATYTVEVLGTFVSTSGPSNTCNTSNTTPRYQYIDIIGAVIGTAFASFVVYTVILFIVLILVCFYWRKKPRYTISDVDKLAKSEHHSNRVEEMTDQVHVDCIYDVIVDETTDYLKPIPLVLKECAAYSRDANTRREHQTEDQDAITMREQQREDQTEDQDAITMREQQREDQTEDQDAITMREQQREDQRRDQDAITMREQQREDQRRDQDANTREQQTEELDQQAL